jgi:putative mRNA 3-end processing factor
MADSSDLIVLRPEGMYCPQGDFYIDPWRPVERALITHAHADHARVGHAHYLAASPSEGVLRARLGSINLEAIDYALKVLHNSVSISFHPAGHVLGSAQVRLEYKGQVWVASGDYKYSEHEELDTTCAPFEPVRCDTFITESTFGLPIYRWQPQAELFADINTWWAANAAQGRASVLYCYSFGKAQRILSGVDANIGPIVVHGAVEPLNRAYREAGVPLPPTQLVSEVTDKSTFKTALVLAPPSVSGSVWMRRFGDKGSGYSDAFASGWMQLRGARRRRGVDKGFVMSDHADWSGLQAAIKATQAERVIVTHGQVPVMVRWLQEQGLQAQAFETQFGEEDNENALAPLQETSTETTETSPTS